LANTQPPNRYSVSQFTNIHYHFSSMFFIAITIK
jgi:hypothetical protein